jgi:DNA-binding GntR family transcriptional regulator
VLVEGELTLRAMPNLTRTDVTRLAALTADYEAATDAQTVAHLNQAFHFSIYARAGSSVLLPVVESLWMQAGPFVRAAVRRHDPAQDAAPTVHHRAIMDAILARDAAAAVRALEADITQAFRILERAGAEVWEATP